MAARRVSGTRDGGVNRRQNERMNGIPDSRRHLLDGPGDSRVVVTIEPRNVFPVDKGA